MLKPSVKEDKEGFLHSCRILMVEDNPLNTFVGIRLFKNWGIELHTAENGRAALELLNQNSYHLILMDLQMPEIDGFETTRIIRLMSDPEKANIPILAISADGEQPIQLRAIEAGMNGFILKPFDPEEMRKMLKKHL